MLETAFLFADSVNIDISKLDDLHLIKYNQPDKLLEFLKKIKSNYLINLGLNSCFELEFLFGVNNFNHSVTSIISPISNIIKKTRTKIFLRIRDNVEEDDLIVKE